MCVPVSVKVNPNLNPAYILDEILIAKQSYLKHNDITCYTRIHISSVTYEYLRHHLRDSIYYTDINWSRTLCGITLVIDDRLEPFTFIIKEDIDMNINDLSIGDFAFTPITFREKSKLPEKYIINKGATILFWEDGTKTVVKRTKDDEYNKIMGFLWAYFQKTSGLSKTKANTYLKELVDADELKAIEFIKSENFNATMSNITESMSKVFEDMDNSFKNKN